MFVISLKSDGQCRNVIIRIWNELDLKVAKEEEEEESTQRKDQI